MCGTEGATEVLALFCENTAARLHLIQQLTILCIIRLHLDGCLDVRQGSDLIAIVVISDST